MRATTTFRALCLGATLGLTACVSVHHDRDYDRHEPYGNYDDDYDYGPAPHGPRYSHGGFDHVWYPSLGVYTVIGFPSVYWHDGWYWRHAHGYWERCGNPRGRHWSRVGWDHVPHRFRGRDGHHYGGGHDRGDRREERWEHRDDRRDDRHERAEDRRDRRNERWEERHDRRDDRREEHHERADERRDDRHRRVEQRRDRHEQRVDAQHAQRVERKTERHERVEQRHEARDERQEQRREERAEKKASRRGGEYAGPAE
jgi:hypothetical protein